MKPNLLKFTGLVAAASLAVAANASAAVVVNTLGNRGDGYTLVQISYDGSGGNTSTWTVPVGVNSVELMVIGGGGAGARGSSAFNGNGGGAGGLYYTTGLGVTSGASISLSVGAGGVTTTAVGNGASGGQSTFGSIIAYGGEGGVMGVRGGNQGGYSTNNGGSITAGFLGGTGTAACGGAGATQNGRNSGFSPAYGGAGATIPITGTFGVANAAGSKISGYYGELIGFAGGGSAGFDGVNMGAQYGESYGGGSGSWPEGIAGTAGYNLTGGGGGGGRSANGGAGGSGVIYIAYQAIPEPTAAVLGSLGLLALLRRRRA